MTYSDIYLRQTRLDDTLRKFGASMVGFCSVTDMEIDICKRYPVGISIAIDLDRDAVADLVNDDRRFSKVTQTARDRLYRVYGMACQLLRSWGYGYVPLSDYPLEETLPNMSVDVPLHLLAAKAGLGWIGKSGMLITTRYGPRVRLGGLLTDAPFERSRPAPGVNEGKCGECRACIEACPVGAIRGTAGHVRFASGRDGHSERIVDAHLCNNWRRESLATLGRKSECGLCVAVCPVGVDSTPDLSLVRARAQQLPDFSIGERDEVTTVGQTLGGSRDARADWVFAPAVVELTTEELNFLLQDDDLLSPSGDVDESADEALVADLLSDDDVDTQASDYTAPTRGDAEPAQVAEHVLVATEVGSETLTVEPAGVTLLDIDMNTAAEPDTERPLSVEAHSPTEVAPETSTESESASLDQGFDVAPSAVSDVPASTVEVADSGAARESVPTIPQAHEPKAPVDSKSIVWPDPKPVVKPAERPEIRPADGPGRQGTRRRRPPATKAAGTAQTSTEASSSTASPQPTPVPEQRPRPSQASRSRQAENPSTQNGQPPQGNQPTQNANTTTQNGQAGQPAQSQAAQPGQQQPKKRPSRPRRRPQRPRTGEAGSTAAAPNGTSTPAPTGSPQGS